VNNKKGAKARAEETISKREEEEDFFFVYAMLWPLTLRCCPPSL
jgi:hypothetical protein